ncbi:MAG: hypothetical protein ACUVX9_08985 [Anaerolineae bacterium]
MQNPWPLGPLWVGLALAYLLIPVAWAYLAVWSRSWPARLIGWLEPLRREPNAAALQVLGRTVYAIGVPYAALLWGIADARRLGLAGFPLWPQLPLGAALTLVGVGYIYWSWRRAATVVYQRSSHHRLLSTHWEALQAPWGSAHLLFDVLCLQLSWAFVRGACIWWLGLYPGVFVSLAVLAAGRLAYPGGIAPLQEPEPRARGLLVGQLAILTALVFLYSENLWLSMVAHGTGLAAATLAAGRGWRRARDQVPSVNGAGN